VSLMGDHDREAVKAPIRRDSITGQLRDQDDGTSPLAAIIVIPRTLWHSRTSSKPRALACNIRVRRDDSSPIHPLLPETDLVTEIAEIKP